MGASPGETRPHRAALALPSEDTGAAHPPRLVAFILAGARAGAPAECRALGCRCVCRQSVCASTAFFAVSQPGVCRPDSWAHLLAAFAVLVVLGVRLSLRPSSRRGG